MARYVFCDCNRCKGELQQEEAIADFHLQVYKRYDKKQRVETAAEGSPRHRIDDFGMEGYQDDGEGGLGQDLEWALRQRCCSFHAVFAYQTLCNQPAMTKIPRKYRDHHEEVHEADADNSTDSGSRSEHSAETHDGFLSDGAYRCVNAHSRPLAPSRKFLSRCIPRAGPGERILKTSPMHSSRRTGRNLNCASPACLIQVATPTNKL